jgi:hypothetical protein
MASVDLSAALAQQGFNWLREVKARFFDQFRTTNTRPS